MWCLCFCLALLVSTTRANDELAFCDLLKWDGWNTTTGPINSTALCVWMRRHCPETDSKLDYLNIYYCSTAIDRAGVWLLGVLLLLLFFCTLAMVADRHFSPTLRTISDTLAIPEEIAGITLLAFGNGAPDLAAVVSAVRSGVFQFAYGELLGGGAFVTMIVVTAIVALSPTPPSVRSFVVSRDVMAYLLSIAVSLLLVNTGTVTIWHGALMLAIYVLFVVFSMLMVYVRPLRALKSRLTCRELPSDFEEEEDALIQDAEQVEEEDGETAALLSAGDKEAPTAASAFEKMGYYWRALITSPLRHSWRAMSPASRISAILTSLPNLLLNMTIFPTSQAAWRSRYVFNVFIPPCSLVWASYVFEFGWISIGGSEFRVWMLMLIVGICFSIFLACATTSTELPSFHLILMLYGFLVCITWVYALATEIVELIKSMGEIIGISHHILGLTVLAWGNSLGDLFANVAIARAGASMMALTACFAGPMLNLLLGLGLGLVLGAGGEGLSVSVTPGILVSALFLIGGLLFSILYLYLFRMRFKKKYGLFIAFIYVVMLLFSILIEIGAI